VQTERPGPNEAWNRRVPAGPADARLLAAAKLYRAIARGDGPPSFVAMAMADDVISEAEPHPAPG